jgi:hypothetical protein
MKIQKTLLSKVLTFPEYLYGVNLVTLYLRDGRQIKKVEIGWDGEILRIEGASPQLNFSAEEIVDAKSEL